jgi:hypothetical protein
MNNNIIKTGNYRMINKKIINTFLICCVVGLVTTPLYAEPARQKPLNITPASNNSFFDTLKNLAQDMKSDSSPQLKKLKNYISAAKHKGSEIGNIDAMKKFGLSSDIFKNGTFNNSLSATPQNLPRMFSEAFREIRNSTNIPLDQRSIDQIMRSAGIQTGSSFGSGGLSGFGQINMANPNVAKMPSMQSIEEAFKDLQRGIQRGR